MSLARIRKVWGWTTEHYHSDECSVHLLEIEAGGYCSLHYHENRANRFVVHSGRVRITEELGPRRSTFVLGPGDVHDTPSLVVHRFETLEDGIMTEVYWPDRGGAVDREDIVRLSEGGKHQSVETPAD